MRKATLLLLALTCAASSASAATRYISDELHTYVHAGPSTQYKIIGSVEAGEHVNVIQTNTNAGFTQIKDSKGRSGWINSKYISNRASLKERLPRLEAELTRLKAQLNSAKDKADKDKANLEQNVESRSKQILELQNTNSTLNEELQQAQALNRNLNAKLDTQKNDLLMRWFSYGGAVGGIGLLLGLLLPRLVPNRRKDRWM